MVDQLQIDQKSTNANNNYLADGSIGGSNILSVNNYEILTFSLYSSSKLHTTGFAGVSSTGFTILTQGLYQLDINLHVKSDGMVTDQPITVSVIGGGDPYILPFVTQSLVSSVTTILMCTASVIVKLNVGDFIQLQNLSEANLKFEECTIFPNGYYMNRMFSLTQIITKKEQ